MKTKNFLLISYSFPPAVSPQLHRVVKIVKHCREIELMPFVLSVKRGNFGARDDDTYKEISSYIGACHRTFSFEPDIIKWLIRYIKGNLGPPLDEISETKNYVEKHAAFPEKSRLRKAIGSKLTTFYNFILPDKFRGWQLTAVKQGLKMIKHYNLEFIYSNSYPYTTHFIAERLHDLTGLPWFMDFRDGWVEDTDIFHPPTRWHRAYIERACDRMLGKARAAFFITPGIRDRYVKRHPELEDRFHASIQGYDSTIVMPERLVRPDKMVLAYLGSFFLSSYSPEPILKAYRLLHEKNPVVASQIIIRFVGNVELAKEMKESLGLDNEIETVPMVSHKDALQEMVDSDVLISILLDTEWNKLRLGTKTFDYIRAGRPVLALVPPDSGAADLLRRTRVGIIIHPEDTRKITGQLLIYYQQWSKGRLKVTANQEEIRKFDSKNIVPNMLAIMRKESV